MGSRLPLHPAPEKTIKLSAFATLRERGGLHNLAKSAVRSLDILELLVESDQPLRAVEIARALTISPSSTDQILKTMVDSGYLVLDSISKRYHLPPRLMRLGAALSTNYFDPDAIDRLLHSVQKGTGATVMLAVPQGLFMQIVEARQIAGQQDAHAMERLVRGLHTPFFGSSTGAAWLSVQDEDVIRRTMHKCRHDLGSHARDVDRMLESLRRVRAQGYAYGGLMADDGLWAVAVPLPPAANGIVLVLVVCGPPELIDLRKAQIARQMQQRIGRYLQRSSKSR